MILAHVVPKKGFSHERGATEMINDIAKPAYNEIILKCDGEPALKRAVQAIAEQVRVIRRGLEQRLDLRLLEKHPVTAWLVERAADLLSKYQVGDDGQTGYERWKGKPFHGEEIEFGEKILYRENIKASAKQNKLDFRRVEVTTWVVGGAQAKLLSGHVLALYLLVLYAALELIAGGTVTPRRAPRRGTTDPREKGRPHMHHSTRHRERTPRQKHPWLTTQGGM